MSTIGFSHGCHISGVMVISIGYPMTVWMIIMTGCFGCISYHLCCFSVCFANVLDEVGTAN